MEPLPKPKEAEVKAEEKKDSKEDKVEKQPSGGKTHDAKDGHNGSSADKEEMKKDPKFSKYFKMIAVGVAKSSVYSKMASEGLSPEDVEKFRYGLSSFVSLMNSL